MTQGCGFTQDGLEVLTNEEGGKGKGKRKEANHTDFQVKYFLSVNSKDKGPEIRMCPTDPENNRDGHTDKVGDERG